MAAMMFILIQLRFVSTFAAARRVRVLGEGIRLLPELPGTDNCATEAALLRARRGEPIAHR